MIHSVVMFSFLALLTVFFMQLVRSMIERPIVETNYGSVRGIFMRSRQNRTFYAFLGIPYAMPPVNESRFQPPQPPKSWKGIRDAGDEGGPCPQPNYFFLQIPDIFVGLEDCLTLNIYTPDITKPSMPVMFYIHGGGWMTGSGSLLLQGPEYFMDKNIVLVSVTYRLGVFGFLSTEDSVLPGNNGLKDQVMALRWVKENIASFGGNPNLVTLFGNSVGASSVHLHMQSPLSKGLYLRGISQSGTAMSAFSVIGAGTSLNITLTIAEKVNCSEQTTEEVVDCLRTVPYRDLLMAQNIVLNSRFDNNVLNRPVVEPPGTENAFLTSSPFMATTTSDWMTGINKEEGAYKYALLHLEGSSKFEFVNKHFEKFGPQTLLIDDTTTDAQGVTKKIQQFYFGNKSIGEKTIPQLINLYTDAWIMYSAVRAVKQHNGTLFFYLFDYRGNLTFPHYFGITEDYGVSHCDELIYLFTMKNIFKGELNERDTKISKLMIDLWTNFATYGNPTPEPISKKPMGLNEGKANFTWKKVVPKENFKYCHIQGDHLDMEENLFPRRRRFWNSLPIYDKCH